MNAYEFTMDCHQEHSVKPDSPVENRGPLFAAFRPFPGEPQDTTAKKAKSMIMENFKAFLSPGTAMEQA